MKSKLIFVITKGNWFKTPKNRTKLLKTKTPFPYY